MYLRGMGLVSKKTDWFSSKSESWTSRQAAQLDVHPIAGRTGTDLDAAIRTLVENEQRQDVNPLERARGYQRLTDAPFNLSQEEVAKRMGPTNPSFSRTLALLDEPPEIQEIMARAIISPRHVRALHTIENESERTALAKQAASKHWSVEETEKRARRAATGGRLTRSEEGLGDVLETQHPVLEKTEAPLQVEG